MTPCQRSMSRLALIVCLAAAVAAGGRQAAAQPGAPHVLPPEARPHGQSLIELATAYMAWALGAPPDDNPFINPRCEQSSIDPHIWFVPASLGGEVQIVCDIPHGSFLVVLAGGAECSEVEGNGSTEADLLACVDTVFADLTRIEARLDGTFIDLGEYVVTTRFDVIPADNLFGPDPTPSMTKGYFFVTTPLSRGTHTLRTFGEFSDGFQAGLTATLIIE